LKKSQKGTRKVKNGLAALVAAGTRHGSLFTAGAWLRQRYLREVEKTTV